MYFEIVIMMLWKMILLLSTYTYYLVNKDVCKSEELRYNKCNPARDCRKRNNETETWSYHNCDTGNVILVNIFVWLTLNGDKKLHICKIEAVKRSIWWIKLLNINLETICFFLLFFLEINLLDCWVLAGQVSSGSSRLHCETYRKRQCCWKTCRYVLNVEQGSIVSVMS